MAGRSADELTGPVLGRGQELLDRLELARGLGGAIDQHPAARAQRLEGLHQLPHAGLELRPARRLAGLLHAGRAVDQDDRRVGPAAGGQAEPAAG